ncbi:NADH-quinone oxidoreductase subunit N [bacterium]|nr:NADH-quinone oxidoreductase subunit N [bacterium]
MSNWFILLPEIILAFTIMLVLIVDLISTSCQRLWLGVLSLVGILLTVICLWIVPSGAFGEAFLNDGLARFIKSIVLLALLLVVLFSWDFDKVWGRPLGEYLVLLLSSGLGILFLASGTEMILLYIGLELTTFPLVLLTAYCPADKKSAEGGLKFLVLAALGAAVLLFGFSLIYAAAGTTQLQALVPALIQTGNTPLVLMGLLCILAGLGFKMALVPFHMWVPDAYEGAPTAITAFLSVAGKTAGFVLAIRILATGFPVQVSEWSRIFAVLAAVTMCLGNFAAIPQTNMKRLLAYSSIAQAGYIVMGLVAFQVLGLSSILYYLTAYLFANLAAFGVVIAVERSSRSVELSAYHGLAMRSPRLALIMLLALLSLAGIPPLAGFAAKFYLFAAVYSEGYIWLVVLAVLNSALSLYYYLKVIRAIYIQKPAADAVQPVTVPLALTIVLVVTTFGILALGVYPSPIVDLAREVVVLFLTP